MRQIQRQQPSEVSLNVFQGHLDHSINRRRYWPFPTLGRTYGFRLTSVSFAPNPSGPRDEQATVALLRKADDGQVLGMIWHYTCQPTAVVPENVSDWLPVFQAAGYFEQTGFSKEDQLRAGFYKANALRAAQQERIGDHDDYLRSLGMTLSLAPFNSAGRTRIAQLISKSNQFNLTTRRYSEAEIAAMQSNADVFTIQARLEDIFGDNGMISAVICRQTGQSWEVDTWIMSCRVLGRRVEEALLQYLVQQARLRGIAEILGRYIPTAKNGLARDHFRRLGIIQTGSQNGETTWRLSVSGCCEKILPLRVDPQREWKLASAGRS